MRKNSANSNISNNFLLVKNIHGSDFKLDFLSIKRSVLLVRALNHSLRQNILRILEEQKKLTVTELHTQLKIEQSVVSQSLAIMRRAGVLSATREGKHIHYQINHHKIDEIRIFVTNLFL